jgi:class 3 adenylate cyclase/tetratricopeptide (TPR) repeat protein
MVAWSSSERALLKSLLAEPLFHALQQPAPPAAALSEGCAQLAETLRTLAPFVPTPVLDRRLANPQEGRITGLCCTGTLLCADLSGFSALTARLAAAGREGSEEISRIVNRLFAALLAEVYRRGGGVLQFGGDGLTAFFDAGRLGAQHAGLAGAAGLAMQASMVDFAAVPTSRGPFRLRLRIACHSGEIFIAEVGDTRHTDLVVTGRASNRVVTAQEQAAPGEVVLSEETRQALTEAVVQPKLAGLYLLHELPTLPPLPMQTSWQPGAPGAATLHGLLARICAVQPYVPRDLPERFLRMDADGGEFRPVTVLFARFYPLRKLLALLEMPNPPPWNLERIGQLLDIYYTQIRDAVGRYEGIINKVDMAHFGNRLLALFGAPQAHEDDPARAVQAAFAVRDALGEADRQAGTLLQEWAEAAPRGRWHLPEPASADQQRIGIAAGTVFAGILGTVARHEYTVMGETVNLAARLLDAAEDGDILLTSRVQQMAQHVAEAQPLPPLALKGLAQPVPAFLALRERTPGAVQPHTTPLIGRREELRRLRDLAVTALRDAPGAGGVVALIGEAGIGKSRLAEETLRRLQRTLPEVRLVQDACQSYEQSSPHATIARLLRRLLRPAPGAEVDVQAAAIRHRLADLIPTWSRFAPLLGPLLNLPIAETPLTNGLTAEQRRARLHELIARIILALAHERPYALIIDDLQWADPSSQAVLAHLATQLTGQPLFLLLIYRPTPDLDALWCGAPQGTAIHLSELQPADSEALLQALLGGEPPAELRRLVEHTNGTPFFLEEIVRYLLESGTLKRDGDGWIGSQGLAGSVLPAQVEQLLVARLDRLDEETRRLVQVAAVIGEQFSEPLLAQIVEAPNSLAPRLDELVGAALLIADDQAATPAYRFRHALIRDVAYGSMLFARRRDLHARVARAITQGGAGEIDNYPVVLAHHYVQAGLPDQAFPQFLAAAQQAQTRFAQREALALYQQALAVAPWRQHDDALLDIETAAMIYENQGDLLAVLGDYEAARGCYEGAHALFRAGKLPGDPLRRSALERKIAGTHEHQGALAVALEWLGQAAHTLVPAPPGEVTDHERARVLSDTGWLYFRMGDLDPAQVALEEALVTISHYANYEEQARILNRLGGVAWTRGDMARAQHYVEQSLRASERSGDLVGQARALNNLGLITEKQGHLADAVQHGIGAMELNERIGNRRDLAISAVNVGFALYHQEDYTQARTYLMQALEIAAAIHDTRAEVVARLNLGRVLSAEGRWDEAEQVLTQAEAGARDSEQEALQLEALVARAEGALERGATAEAEQLYRQAEPLATDPESEEYGRFRRLNGRLAAAQGRKPEAIAAFSVSAALFARLRNVPEAEKTRRLLAALDPPNGR